MPSRTILLVEDNRSDVALTKRALELGHIANQLVVAEDGQEAQAALRRMPVVVLTSSNEEQDLATSYDLGVNSYIRRPVAITRLDLYWLIMNESPPPSQEGHL